MLFKIRVNNSMLLARFQFVKHRSVLKRRDASAGRQYSIEFEFPQVIRKIIISSLALVCRRRSSGNTGISFPNLISP